MHLLFVSCIFYLSRRYIVYGQISSSKLEDYEISDLFLNFIHAYNTYCEKIRKGEHGLTAKYWMDYIDLVDLYSLFSRASRTCTNDLNLFTYALGKMILHVVAIFFATNRPNYARWMTRSRLNLLNSDITHPGLKQVLESGEEQTKHFPQEEQTKHFLDALLVLHLKKPLTLMQPLV